MTLANWAKTGSMNPRAPTVASRVRFVAKPATMSATSPAKPR